MISVVSTESENCKVCYVPGGHWRNTSGMAAILMQNLPVGKRRVLMKNDLFLFGVTWTLLVEFGFVFWTHGDSSPQSQRHWEMAVRVRASVVGWRKQGRPRKQQMWVVQREAELCPPLHIQLGVITEVGAAVPSIGVRQRQCHEVVVNPLPYSPVLWPQYHLGPCCRRREQLSCLGTAWGLK